MLPRVVLAIAEERVRRPLRQVLRKLDISVAVVKGKNDMWARAVGKSGDLILIDQDSFEAAVAKGADLTQGLPVPAAVVVVSESESTIEHASLIAAGSTTVLHSDLSEDSLREALEAILAKQEDLGKVALARKPLAKAQLSDFVSNSPAMQEFVDVVSRLVQSDSSLLILGETGVGKERLARAIHAEGPRTDGPFVAVNCGALPDSLLESELFGHEEGAFTGATRARKGAFELAHGGTIFLDEVGDMPVHLQVKLLRVLQDHEVQRVGAECSFEVNVRVMAASNRDLEAEVEARQFRRDLFYRVSVVCLTVPPLRDRREDIPTLTFSYLEYHYPRIGREVTGITDQAMESLCRYSWPGNVRELINVIERAMLLCRGDKITVMDLPASITAHAGALPSSRIPRRSEEVPDEWLGMPLKELRDSVVADLERAYLGAMLKATGGKVGETARRAGIEPRSAYSKMKLYGLAKEDFKPKNSRPHDRK